MNIHESSINFKKLIQDLADMYPQEVSEVVITELIANSLDAKATRIAIDYNPKEKILVFTDNGDGMDESQFDEYHDFAAGLKSRGTGIGFAGLGAKISFNVADQVITETKSKSFSGASNWYLKSNKNLIWEEIEPAHIKEYGTKVEIHFKQKASITFENTEDILKVVKSQYLPLMDRTFLELYSKFKFYPTNFRFKINGRTVEPIDVKSEYKLSRIHTFNPKKKGKRYGFGLIGLAEKDYPVAPDICGLLLCTHGKVIKSELFNQFPGQFGARIFGIVEVPEFVHFLTTSKTDFTRKGRFRNFEAIFSPIREEFKKWLKELGVESTEIFENNEALRLEKEIRKILDDIPELSYFFGFYSRKKVMKPSENGEITAEEQEGVDVTYPDGDGHRGDNPGLSNTGEQPGSSLIKNQKDLGIKVKPISRSTKRGPKFRFEDNKDRVEMSWAEGNNIVINKGHPLYNKVKSNKTAEFLFCLFAIGTAVQRFKGEENRETEPDFSLVDRMMAAWAKK